MNGNLAPDIPALPLERALGGAARATRPVARTDPATRARWLRAAADYLDAAATQLVPVAAAETHLSETRLSGELGRTTSQARLLADRLEDGHLADVRVDLADPDWATGPRPDLRRTHVPLGTVLVFAAGNFPFAFSVFGGDTVSALAAGCPVVVKAHPGHPELSRRTAAVVTAALTGTGAPDGAFGLVEGVAEGALAVRDPRVKAVGFTGSTEGGRALYDLAATRPVPIPFYGELGSTNPVLVTPTGWATRADHIAAGFAASVTLGAGQFCTKPGVVLVPDADDFLARVPRLPTSPLLNDDIAHRFAHATARMARTATLARPRPRPRTHDDAHHLTPAPVLFRATVTDAAESPELLALEMFGPAALILEYSDFAEALALVDLMDGQLTGTVQGGADLDPDASEALLRLAEHVGRLVWNQWPTGVSVTDAQHHGGPYPASTAPWTTSVGPAAIARFQRPVVYQNVPPLGLPPELRDPHAQ